MNGLYNNLTSEIKKSGFSTGEFCRQVKINKFLFLLKIFGIIDFKYLELCRIMEFFNLKLSCDYLFHAGNQPENIQNPT